MARLMSELSPSSKVKDYATYEKEVKEFVGRYHGKPLGEVEWLPGDPPPGPEAAVLARVEAQGLSPELGPGR